MLSKVNHGGRGGWIALLALAALSGPVATLAPRPAGAAEYVGAETPDVKAEDRAVVAHPQPVQVIFQFKTKGAPNARATKMIKSQVLDVIKASGDFSDISETATPNGALLSVVIDNVITPSETAADEGKGFATGATFFLVGNTVKDSYVCTVDYTAGPGAPTITKIAHHALYTQIGLTAPAPKDAIKVGAMKEAIAIMIRQIVSNPLNQVATDPAFQPASTPAPAAATPVALASPAPGAPTTTVPTVAAPLVSPSVTPTPTASAPAETTKAETSPAKP